MDTLGSDWSDWEFTWDPREWEPINFAAEEIVPRAVTAINTAVDFAAEEIIPRAMGVVKVVGGVVEGAAGAGMVVAGAATSEVGVGIPLTIGGYVVALHAASGIAAGVSQIWTGEQTDTLASTALQAVGVNRNTANSIDAVASFTFSLGEAAAPSPRTVSIADDLAGHTDDSMLAPTGAAEEIPNIETGYGPAQQGTSEAATSARPQVQAGAPLYRIGTSGKSQAAQGQFWALEHPQTPGFAGRYGIPPENVANYDFVEQGQLGEGVSFITREAPPVGPSPGGGIEIVVSAGGIRLNWFSYIGPKGLEP